jgi:glycine betaine/proline transport system substrate-binding protein
MTRACFRSLLPALALAIAVAAAGPAGAQSREVKSTIRMAGNDWQSSHFHNAVAQFILEKGYGCKTVSVPGTTQPLLNALSRGDVDILMELWKANNVEIWAKMMRSGRVVETGGVSIQGAVQGWFVPRYVVEGNKKRGIKASAPGLKSVADLPKYKALFRDPEEPSKGRFYNCKLGWNCERVNSKKLVAYKLLGDFTNFQPGSGAALAAAIGSAFKRGKPIVFYYWGPTWVLGKYDVVMLKEPPYDKAKWDKLDKSKDGRGLEATAYPTIKVYVAANKKFAQTAPKVMAFLGKYAMKDDLVNKALVYMRENKDKTGRKAAMEFLKAHPAIWTKWVPADVAARVKAGL